MAAAPQGSPVTLVANGIRRQLPLDYSGGNVTVPVTNGLSCNVAGTVVFKDGAGNTVTRYMNAGVDYPWEVTQITNSGTTASMGLYGLYSQ